MSLTLVARVDQVTKAIQHLHGHRTAEVTLRHQDRAAEVPLRLPGRAAGASPLLHGHQEAVEVSPLHQGLVLQAVAAEDKKQLF